jgi:hypothetical protein
MQGELKVRELERFKACYCGLCHALGKKYGIVARFILNYEFVFLAMLLWGEVEPLDMKRGRCVASPFRRKRYCARNGALDSSAGYSVILTWWKLRDSIADEPFLKTIPHRFVSVVLSKAYKKAARDFPEFDIRVREEVAALSCYESQAERSLDGAADKFAQILKAAAPSSAPEEMRRPLIELLYHLGRWVYLIDACDDYIGDVSAGRYNPVAALLPPQEGKLPESSAGRLKTTLTHSNNLLCSAFELLPENVWSQIVRNMIYLGMPYVCASVLEGDRPVRRRNFKQGMGMIHERSL